VDKHTLVLLEAIERLVGEVAARDELLELGRRIGRSSERFRFSTDRMRKEKEVQFRLLSRISDDLRKALADTEARVRERTESLERRTAQLRAATEVAGSVTALRNIAELLPHIAGIIAERFSFYQVVIFLLSDDGRQFRAVAAAGATVAAMIDISFDTSTERSICAWVARNQTQRVVPDVLVEPLYWAHPSLPATRSEVALPLIAGGRLLGVLDVQSDQPDAFGPQDVPTLQAVADQIATAIENARLFGDVQSKNLELEATRGELAKLNATLEARVADQLRQLERLNRLKRFFSPQVSELILAGNTEDPLKSHRREITVAFIDLRGFTAFAETAEPEEVMAVLQEFHAAMGEIILKHQGTLERFTGDGMMIFFNDPVPVPNPQVLAVRMAVEMREHGLKLQSLWRKRGFELNFGAGIAHGFATIGTIGFQGRWDYGAIGTVTNLAARLCGEAAPSQILISQRLLGVVEDAVDAEPVGDLALRGFARPVPAFNVRGLLF
jgi:class 3 adenylate cyclase/putative methionine-R-sulfoxide reductase with GAF domain